MSFRVDGEDVKLSLSEAIERFGTRAPSSEDPWDFNRELLLSLGAREFREDGRSWLDLSSIVQDLDA